MYMYNIFIYTYILNIYVYNIHMYTHILHTCIRLYRTYEYIIHIRICMLWLNYVCDTTHARHTVSSMGGNYTYIFILYINIYINILIERNRGVSYLLCSLIKNPEEEDPPWRITPKIDQCWGWFFGGGPLPPGSWFGNHPTKKLPTGGGFLSINV